eukprot:3941690-Rhodomonas_salina.1
MMDDLTGHVLENPVYSVHQYLIQTGTPSVAIHQYPCVCPRCQYRFCLRAYAARYCYVGMDNGR